MTIIKRPDALEGLPRETQALLRGLATQAVTRFQEITHLSAGYLRERAALMEAGWIDQLTGPEALRWFADQLDGAVGQDRSLDELCDALPATAIQDAESV